MGTRFAILGGFRTRSQLHLALSGLVRQEGLKPLARQLGIHPSTIRRWLTRPESIDLYRAILALEKTHPDALARLQDTA